MLKRISADARILWQLAKGQARTGQHGDRLAAFYGSQAERYDAFRERLLPGRAELYAALDLAPDAHLVELGAGTGRNLQWLADSSQGLPARVDLVDLCLPLLDIARARWRHQPNVHCHLADATRWQPSAPVDAVVFSYALTMIPDWQAALDNAWKMLKPGGTLAVVDFTLRAEQRPLARTFWQRWFAHDGVHLDHAHTTALQARFPSGQLTIERTRLPYLPMLRVPYYRFLGRRT